LPIASLASYSELAAWAAPAYLQLWSPVRSDVKPRRTMPCLGERALSPRVDGDWGAKPPFQWGIVDDPVLLRLARRIAWFNSPP
jgi:hypothetical protein